MDQPRRTTAQTVTAAVTLVSGEHETESLDGEFRYDAADPYAVVLTVRTPTGTVVWSFARDLLADGLYEPVGDGDVQVWPCLSTEAAAVVVIELHAPGGEALLQASSRAVQWFVREMYSLVPVGSESAHLGIDSMLEQLLAS